MLRPCHGLSRYCSTSEYGPLLGRGGQIVNKASANVPQYIDPFCVVRLFYLLWLGQLSPLLSAARMASGVVPHVNSDGNCESSFIARLTRFQSFEPRLVAPLPPTFDELTTDAPSYRGYRLRSVLAQPTMVLSLLASLVFHFLLIAATDIVNHLLSYGRLKLYCIMTTL